MVATADRLWLAAHVCWCVCDEQVILLDTRTNQYLAVTGGDLETLHQLVGGLSGVDVAANLTRTHPAQRLVNRLRQRKMLSSAGPPAVAQRLEPATSSLDSLDTLPRPPIGLCHVVRLAMAAAAAALALRLGSLQTIARHVERSGLRLGASRKQPSPHAIVQAVAAYEWLRPLLFSSHEKCLLDSLTLVYFLASQGIAANWVIGVKAAPFGAHAWAQRAGVALGDQHMRVRRYTPILVA